ncbi:uncharacterized protein [Lepeophtheirus salmonis]|uniref:uncharacterized protein isoform X2 n=1 Tax=Lepeophtheirus salmonis TaxID=72036 RepID=UPI003AF3D940
MLLRKRLGTVLLIVFSSNYFPSLGNTQNSKSIKWSHSQIHRVAKRELVLQGSPLNSTLGNQTLLKNETQNNESNYESFIQLGNQSTLITSVNDTAMPINDSQIIGSIFKPYYNHFNGHDSNITLNIESPNKNIHHIVGITIPNASLSANTTNMNNTSLQILLMDELGQNETVHLQPDLAFKSNSTIGSTNNDTNIGNDTSLEFEHVDQNKTLKAYLIKQNVTSKENVSVSPGSNFSSIKTVTTTSNNLQNTSIETTEVNHDEKINPQLNSSFLGSTTVLLVRPARYTRSHQDKLKDFKHVKVHRKRKSAKIKLQRQSSTTPKRTAPRRAQRKVSSKKYKKFVTTRMIETKTFSKSASTKGSKEASDFKNLENDEMGKDMEEPQRASQDTLTTPTLGRTFHLKKVDFYKEKNKSTHEESVFTSMSAMSKYSSTDSGHGKMYFALNISDGNESKNEESSTTSFLGVQTSSKTMHIDLQKNVNSMLKRNQNYKYPKVIRVPQYLAPSLFEIMTNEDVKIIKREEQFLLSTKLLANDSD